MRILKLLFGGSPLTLSVLVLIGAQALAGLGGAAILTVLTRAAGHTDSPEIGLLMLSAIAALVLFIFAQRYATHRTVARVEHSIHDVRVRIMDKLSRTDLRTFERIGDANLLSCVEKDMKVISNASVALLSAGQSAMLLVFAVGYLGWLAPMALVICAAVIGLGLLFHFGKMRTIAHDMNAALRAETQLFGLVGHMVGGFKELKLHRRRRHEIYDELVRDSLHVAELGRAAFTASADHQILIQSILYVVIGAVVFLLPQLVSLTPVLIIKIVAAILFLVGPLNHFVGILPLYAQAEAAALRIDSLEGELDSAPDIESTAAGSVPPILHRIELTGVRFTYPEKEGPGFGVGPVDLAILPGELIFVTGGNGSGKSTFLKLLTGLLQPDSGTIRLNGARVERADSAAYRNLFAAIFWDYHLFPTLYGVDAPDVAAVETLLKRLALIDKTRLVNRSFTSLGLSTGQRKRLAHLVALLEDRQIYIFDEWAADQDPTFRNWFYHFELPRLKVLGKTVIAVTHDEQYIGLADRWLHFEVGHCAEFSPAQSRTSAAHHEKNVTPLLALRTTGEG